MKYYRVRSEHKQVADEVTHPRPEGEEEVEDVQVMLNSNPNPCSIRDLKVVLVSCDVVQL